MGDVVVIVMEFATDHEDAGLVTCRMLPVARLPVSAMYTDVADSNTNVHGDDTVTSDTHDVATLDVGRPVPIVNSAFQPESALLSVPY